VRRLVNGMKGTYALLSAHDGVLQEFTAIEDELVVAHFFFLIK